MKYVSYVIILSFLILNGCAASTQEQKEPALFTSIANGETLDNATSSHSLSLTFQSVLFQQSEDVERFLQQRATSLPNSRPWVNNYPMLFEQVDFQKSIAIFVIQEGLIDSESMIESVYIQNVKVHQEGVEVTVFLPEPTIPACQQKVLWIFGGKVCTNMAFTTNTFHLITIPRESIPTRLVSVTFLDQKGTLLSAHEMP